MNEIDVLKERLQALESERDIRACINRYMALCDELSLQTPMDELGDLFTEDAVWEGKGKRYANSFGGFQGRDAIVTMLGSYASEPPHFALNVHFLTSELIVVERDHAHASWNMLQTSTFASGASHLNSARLDVRFKQQEGRWRIAHFQTENLFSRPVDHWQSDEPLPVPEK
ncbi:MULTISPECIES: nuclear transport factor 2 family protein [unclassified Oceanobacter]|jgi:ketosteroid isomerase-like protein|uniref:nuclear transport factor 2 family protein n=1 Tax=unclassified Oceanobacter TaxID=2620260 RepID=UPI0026E333D2|nr:MULTISPECIES: nuclear transport factor 2 family protein [unclassified Oceanobacter]MDO6683266.1 nuclear transport factor 2 family protein [Oceanobacter sp. 5_MG-2023]MDP2504169.1 nuclear transport factor 2 family protein [Oceanobacter sp. 3_MG-2023]MDP2546607.1 nuclear transport factor 2 family protein [Oceanobacter sp. 4_MG-2023]MDP2610213.1 nuclear transport factor 2 family protein [Oceanobacter sp. 1_MG-2023]MDP2613479.1 nuclear transport factor 2 family protein [Oceanobacter sp. 2_MG-20